jgi:uncharacterized tellurite resistance protein B-like protein
MPNREDAIDSLRDLDAVEANAFALLVRTVVRADGGVSDSEREGLASIAAEMGEERFWKFMERAEAVHGKEAVERAARRVERMSARTLIFVTLSELAVSETIVATEAAVLDWLADLWHLEISTVEEPSDS